MTPLAQYLSQIPAHPLVHALGWTLLHFCWQGALVAAALWSVLGALGGRSSQVRYGAACVALGLLVALPLATFARVASAEYALRAQTWNTAVVLDPGFVLQVGAGAPTEPWPARLALALDHCVPWILLAWFAGVLVFLSRLNFGLMVARRLQRAETETPPSDLLHAFDTLRLRLGIARAVRLLHSARVQVPTVIGWLRPVVLIPASCLTGLSTEQIEAIFCHELAHVRRHDYLVSVFQSVVETLLFYHPAVWWISKQVRRERECCCDAVAVGMGSDVLAYARALSYLEERRAAFPEFVLGANGGALKMRIKRLLGRPESSAASQLTSVALLAILILVAGATVGRRVHAQAAAPPAATSSASTLAGDILQQTLDQVETDAQQRTDDAFKSEIEQLQQQLSEIESTAPQLQRQIADARRKAEEANQELRALQERKQLEDSQSVPGRESSSQYPELGRQFEEAQHKAQETLRALNNDQLRKQFADAQSALAKLHSDQLGKQLDEMLKNQDGVAQHKQMEDLLNSPAFRKQFEDAQAAAARLNSPEYRKQLDDALKAAQNLNTGELNQQLNQLLAQNKAITVLPGGHLYAAPQPPVPQPQWAAPWKPESPKPTGPQRISSGVAAGLIISQPQPVYPPEAKAQHVQGVVVLHARISKQGTVENVEVVSGPPPLLVSAIDAVRKWKYKPYLIDGEPMEIDTTININYSLDDAKPQPAPQSTAPGAPQGASVSSGRFALTARLAMSKNITSSDPAYPAIAKAAHLQGSVILSASVSESGEVQDLKVISGVPMLLSAAMEQAKQIKFGSAKLSGKPYPVSALIAINFIYGEAPRSGGIDSQGMASYSGESHTRVSLADGASQDLNGVPVRTIGGNVTSPMLIYRVDADMTPEARQARFMGIVLISLIVDQKGVPQNVHVLRGVGMGLDEKAVEAAKQYRFRAAREDGKPVPVALNVEFSFKSLDSPKSQAQPSAPPTAIGTPASAQAGVVPPVLIKQIEPEFTEEARKAKVSGTVLVAFAVNEQGLPEDVHSLQSDFKGRRVDSAVVRGMIDNATNAVKQYRFKPAILNGQPVRAPLHVQVNYQIF